MFSFVQNMGFWYTVVCLV